MPIDTESLEVSDELDAVIQGARQRPRRRRLAYLALGVTAMLGAGVFFFVDGGGSSTESGPPGQGGRAAPATASGPSAHAYRCPAVDPVPVGDTSARRVVGCRVRFTATLPAGWHQGARALTAFPPGLVGAGVGAFGIQFANFALGRGSITPWPPPGIPSDGLAMTVDASRSLPGKFRPTTVTPLEPDDFRTVANDPAHPVATTRLEAGGWRFVVETRVGSSEPSAELLDQANAVLASIRTDEHLCPCPGS